MSLAAVMEVRFWNKFDEVTNAHLRYLLVKFVFFYMKSLFLVFCLRFLPSLFYSQLSISHRENSFTASSGFWGIHPIIIGYKLAQIIARLWPDAVSFAHCKNSPPSVPTIFADCLCIGKLLRPKWFFFNTIVWFSGNILCGLSRKG
jgi:hypothetical protein